MIGCVHTTTTGSSRDHYSGNTILTHHKKDHRPLLALPLLLGLRGPSSEQLWGEGGWKRGLRSSLAAVGRDAFFLHRLCHPMWSSEVLGLRALHTGTPSLRAAPRHRYE